MIREETLYVTLFIKIETWESKIQQSTLNNLIINLKQFVNIFKIKPTLYVYCDKFGFVQFLHYEVEWWSILPALVYDLIVIKLLCMFSMGISRITLRDDLSSCNSMQFMYFHHTYLTESHDFYGAQPGKYGVHTFYMWLHPGALVVKLQDQQIYWMMASMYNDIFTFWVKSHRQAE